MVAAARVAERGRQRARDARPTSTACSTSSRGGCASCSTRAARGGRAAGRRRRAADRRRAPAKGRRSWSARRCSRARVEERSRARARRSERVDSVLDDPEVDRDVTRRVGARTGLWVPLVVRGPRDRRDRGPRQARRRDARFTDNDLRLAETFATRAAVAVDLSERVARDALRRVVDAQELERRRLARELHDETGQALTSILLGLKPLEDGRRRPRRSADAARARGRDAAGRAPARGRAAAEGARRLRPRPRARAADRGASPSRPGSPVDFEASALGRAPAGRGRDGALPDRPGVADERRQARPARTASASSLTRSDGRVTAVIEDDGRASTRDDPARAASGSSACASGSSCSTAR